MSYSREVIAEVLAANDIYDVINPYLELKPAGGERYKALCPFHNEKTPSFTVSRDRQTFYCFGCEKHGDAITFISEHDGLSFMEALQKLADRAGVRLPAEGTGGDRRDQERRRLLELGAFALKFYRSLLEDPLKGSAGRQYLKTRTLKPDTEKRFALGYVPEGYENFVTAAQKAGFNDRLLESSGLVRQGQRGGFYDFFRNRLMIPIRDVSGNVVAFGGRDLSGEAPGKYINTPENAVYKKSNVLYGLYEARDALRKAKRALLVEGYFDVMRCFDSGVENVVATCGTALTSGQAKLLKRYVNEVVVVYDGDAAGIKAAMRGIAILTTAGLSVRVLTLPGGLDPDDFLKSEGSEAFLALVEDAPDFIAFYVRANEEKLKTIEGRTEVAHELLAIVYAIDDAIRRDEYLKLAAQHLRVDQWTLRREYESLQHQKHAHDAAVLTKHEGGTTYRPIGTRRADSEFIAAILSSDILRGKAKTVLEGIPLQDGPVAEVLQHLFGDANGLLSQLESEDARALYAAASNLDGLEGEKAEEIVSKWLNTLRRTSLDAEEQRIRNAITVAERAKDFERLKTLMRERSELRRKRESVGAV